MRFLRGARTGRVPMRRQRGVTIVLAAICIGLAMTALGAIDIGHVYLARRDMKRTADLAAAAGVQLINSASGCAGASAEARSNATANGLPTGSAVAVQCGRWDTSANPAPSYFSATGTPQNAIQVSVSENVPYFFLGPARTIQATSIAEATNVGAYTIGTSLLAVGGPVCGTGGSSGLVNGILNALLGTGNGLQLSAASYCGLAGARFKISDLMAAANALTVNQLLTTSVTVKGLAQLMVTALSQTSVVNADLQTSVDALKTIADANIPGSQTFPIGNSSGAPGLLALGLADTQAAFNATVSPFDALLVAAEIDQQGQSPVTVLGGLNLPGLSTNLSVQVIQPPVLAVGEAGINPATGAYRTLASSAQVRAYLNVAIGTLGLNLGPLGQLFSLNVNLPVNIEVAPGQAWLASTQCAATQAASQSNIGVETGLATVCVGDPPANQAASQAFSCGNPATIASAAVGGASVVAVQAALSVPLVNPQSGSVTFDGTVADADNTSSYQGTDSNDLGTVMANTLSSVSSQLSAPHALTATLLGVPISVSGIAGPILSLLTPALTSLLSQLDTVFIPVLQLLGAQVGISTIHDQSLTCGVSQLVD
jgi:uncharacterized membrane protein